MPIKYLSEKILSKFRQQLTEILYRGQLKDLKTAVEDVSKVLIKKYRKNMLDENSKYVLIFRNENQDFEVYEITFFSFNFDYTPTSDDWYDLENGIDTEEYNLDWKMVLKNMETDALIEETGNLYKNSKGENWDFDCLFEVGGERAECKF